MKKNMGNADRIFRVILAAIVVVLYLTGAIPGAMGLLMLVMSSVVATTGIVGFSPLYAVFGVSSCPKPTEQQR
jgi:uncharacterized membrane protein YccC